jgi:DNA-binding NarL/FixJ family response regulator
MATRLFLLDDHEIVRAGLRSLFESSDEFVIVGEAATAEEALSRIPPTRPDVAILDVRLPDGNGIEVCREITSSSPQVACLMLTSYADDEALLASVMAGASGYVVKQVASSNLMADVRPVAAGETLIDPSLLDRAKQRLLGKTASDPLLASLTPQERRILDLIAEGWTNRQIGESLYLAEKTVKNYITNLLAKLGMDRRTQAASYATRVAERAARQRRGDVTGT